MILHPAVIAWAIKDKCAKIARSKELQLKGVTDKKMRRELAMSYNRSIKEEKERHAAVRVVKGRKGWTLCYAADKPSQGTGPFDTVDEAVSWFLRGGR